MAAPTVFCTTGPHGVVVYGEPWSYNPSAGGVSDGRKFTGRLDAVATNYGEITLSWTLPLASLIDRFAVVRASYGAPRSRYTGFTVVEAASDGPLRSISDANLTPARWYYYSLYVREAISGRWVLAGTAQQISVRDWGHHKEMMNNLPTFYRTMDRQMVSSVDKGPLFRFMQLFAFELDLERTLAKSVEQSRSMPDVGAQMLPSYAADFGLNYEAVFGDAKMRGILDRIIKWRKGKGDQETLTEIVRTLSACSDGFVQVVPNILLDHNDSGFDEPTIGRWVSLANATVTRSTSGSPGPRSSTGYMKVQATAGADVHVSSSSTSTILTHGIKVTPNAVYTASAYVRANAATRSVSAGIDWFDSDGVQITAFYEPGELDTLGPFAETPMGQAWWKGPHGPSPYGTGAGDPGVVGGLSFPATDNTTNWQTRVYFIQQAPATAAFARVVLTVPSAAASEIHFFDEIQFEKGEAPTDYEPARKVLVYACGDRKNVVENPSFEADVQKWSAVNTNLTLTTTAARVKEGGQALQISPLAAGPVSVSTVVAVSDAKYYTFSAWLLPLNALTRVMLTIEWMDDDNQVLRVSSAEDHLTQGYWNRPAVTDVGPVGATQATLSIVTYPLVGQTLALDGVLCEAGTALQDYFDGSFGGEDWQWTGADNNSQSIFIANRQVFAEVLGRYLDEFVPATTPWEIVYTA